MKLSATLTGYFYAKELSTKSRTWYEQKLTAFIEWVEGHSCGLHEALTRDIEGLDTTHIREFLGHLRTTGISSQTVHGYARAIKAWANWCIGEGLLPERVTRRLEMPKREQRVIPIFTKRQIDQLFAACERPGDQQYPWLAERDKTILMVLLDTGIRASELCDLNLDRVILDRQNPYIVVNGKGKKQREIGLGVRCRQQLHRYIHRDRPQTTHPQLFLTRDRQPLDPKGLAAFLYRLKKLTGITGVRCSPHDFRHHYAYHYIAQGGDVLRLSRLLGHTDLATTQHYLRAFDSRQARMEYLSVLDSL